MGLEEVIFAVADVIGIVLLGSIFSVLLWRCRPSAIPPSDKDRVSIEREHIRQMLRSSIQRIELTEPYLCPMGMRALYPIGWNEALARLLQFGLDSSAVSREEVIGWVDELIAATGRKCFGGQYPDHTSNPAALAFAIEREVLSSDEIERINFDHGQTWETFVEEYGEPDLSERTLEFLLLREEE